MKKPILFFMLVAMTCMLSAQDIEFRMGDKTNKKAYSAKMIKMAEGMQEGQLLVVEPELKAIAVGAYSSSSVKSLKLRLCNMEWNDVKSVSLPDTKKYIPYEAFRTGERLHTIICSDADNRLKVRHIAANANTLDVLGDNTLADATIEKNGEYGIWTVNSPDGQYHGVVYALWGKKENRAVAMLFDRDMNKLWERQLHYSDVFNVIVTNSGTIVTMRLGMVEDNKDITAFRVQTVNADGERHGEYILDADVSDVALLNADDHRVLAVALEGKGGYGLLRMGTLGHRNYTGLWGLVFDLEKQQITVGNRHPFTDDELLAFSNEAAGGNVSDKSIKFICKVDECTTPQGGAVLYQHAWKVETRDQRGMSQGETVYSKGILVVQADMNGALTVSRLPQNNQNANWPDVGADVLMHGDRLYVVTNESKDETDEYTPDRPAKRSKSLILANMALSVYWFTPDGQGTKKVVERNEKALLKTPLSAGSADRFYLLCTGGMAPKIGMLKLPSAQ